MFSLDPKLLEKINEASKDAAEALLRLDKQNNINKLFDERLENTKTLLCHFILSNNDDKQEEDDEPENKKWLEYDLRKVLDKFLMFKSNIINNDEWNQVVEYFLDKWSSKND